MPAPRRLMLETGIAEAKNWRAFAYGPCQKFSELGYDALSSICKYYLHNFHYSKLMSAISSFCSNK